METIKPLIFNCETGKQIEIIFREDDGQNELLLVIFKKDGHKSKDISNEIDGKIVVMKNQKEIFEKNRNYIIQEIESLIKKHENDTDMFHKISNQIEFCNIFLEKQKEQVDLQYFLLNDTVSNKKYILFFFDEQNKKRLLERCETIISDSASQSPASSSPSSPALTTGGSKIKDGKFVDQESILDSYLDSSKIRELINQKNKKYIKSSYLNSNEYKRMIGGENSSTKDRVKRYQQLFSPSKESPDEFLKVRFAKDILDLFKKNYVDSAKYIDQLTNKIKKIEELVKCLLELERYEPHINHFQEIQDLGDTTVMDPEKKKIEDTIGYQEDKLKDLLKKLGLDSTIKMPNGEIVKWCQNEPEELCIKKIGEDEKKFQEHLQQQIKEKNCSDVAEILKPFDERIKNFDQLDDLQDDIIEILKRKKESGNDNNPQIEIQEGHPPSGKIVKFINPENPKDGIVYDNGTNFFDILNGEKKDEAEIGDQIDDMKKQIELTGSRNPEKDELKETIIEELVSDQDSKIKIMLQEKKQAGDLDPEIETLIDGKRVRFKLKDPGDPKSEIFVYDDDDNPKTFKKYVDSKINEKNNYDDVKKILDPIQYEIDQYFNNLLENIILNQEKRLRKILQVKQKINFEGQSFNTLNILPSHSYSLSLINDYHLKLGRNGFKSVINNILKTYYSIRKKIILVIEKQIEDKNQILIDQLLKYKIFLDKELDQFKISSQELLAQGDLRTSNISNVLLNLEREFITQNGGRSLKKLNNVHKKLKKNKSINILKKKKINKTKKYLYKKTKKIN